MQGESLSAGTSAADDFKHTFSRLVEEECYSLHQVFNAHETGLYWCLLPNKTLADGTEKNCKNIKSSKDRIILTATTNASGDFRLPLVFIHKSAKPRCFSGINMSALPVHYYAQKNMDGSDNFFRLVLQAFRSRSKTLSGVKVLRSKSYSSTGQCTFPSFCI